MIARLPGGAVLCLDEAYADFAPADAMPPLDPHEPRVIRMRTFSKAHGHGRGAHRLRASAIPS